MREKIIITGAAGFIGSYIANNIANDYDLILIDSLEFGGDPLNLDIKLRNKLINNNCLNSESISHLFKDAKYCIHLAGISSLPENEDDYPRAIINNFQSTVNILELSIKFKLKKFLFASTSALYENNQKYPFSEKDLIDPDLMYSYSKKICEEYIQFRTKKNDSIPCFCLRFFNVFGPNQNKARKNPPLTAYLINCITKGEKAILYNNSPDIKRDYIFVEDVKNLCLKLIQINNLKNYEIINVTSGKSYSVIDIIKNIEEVFEKKLIYEFADTKNIWNKYTYLYSKIDISRIEKEVRKTSIGDKEKIQVFLGNEYKFKTMYEGLTTIKTSENATKL